jgi:peptide/nickel transport system permease protein
MSQRLKRTFALSPGLFVGIAIIFTLVLAAFVAPLPHNPLEPNASATLLHPGSRFWFGTDTNGFDVFSRTIRAARLDVPLAIIGTLLSMAIGIPIGLFASGRGKISEGAMRGLDIFQAFPLLILALVIVALTGNHLRNIVVAIALINAPAFVRLVRSQSLALRQARFVEAARSIGASNMRVLLRHVLPNVSGPIAAQAALTAAQSIVVIAAMTFLGIGITPPAASWGAMIQAGSANVPTGQWWVSAFPGIAILVTVVSFHLIADGMQRVLDPTAHG